MKYKHISKDVARDYTSMPHPTCSELAEKYGVGVSTIYNALRLEIGKDELRRLSGIRKSKSKTGNKNPQFGKQRALTLVRRCNYLAEWDRNKQDYTMVHRKKIMEVFGMSKWPAGWHVHHIDENPENNSLDNLAIVTERGHNGLHARSLKLLTKWEREQFGTSVLQGIIATLQRG